MQKIKTHVSWRCVISLGPFNLKYLSKLKKHGVLVSWPYHLVVFLACHLDSVVKVQSVAAHTFIPLRFLIHQHSYSLFKNIVSRHVRMCSNVLLSVKTVKIRTLNELLFSRSSNETSRDSGESGKIPETKKGQKHHSGSTTSTKGVPLVGETYMLTSAGVFQKYSHHN
jgi:hypothetical protein